MTTVEVIANAWMASILVRSESTYLNLPVAFVQGLRLGCE
jgi:hypothetical protein